MSGRIDWGAYNGDDIEEVVAMMINLEHPRSTRITPSQGDGGIDVLDIGAGADGGDVVYQIKRYASSLKADQKSKVKSSLTQLLIPEEGKERWQDLNVTEWHLVTPWGPTEVALRWFNELLGEHPRVKGVWDGSTRINAWASKYTHVIDYYLLGGRSEIRDAQMEVLTLSSLKDVDDGDLQAPAVAARISAAVKVLEKDPHYKFELRFGHGDPSAVSRPGLVISCYYIDREAQTWHAVDVIARCAWSVHERPITLTGVLSAERGTPEEESLEAFIKYGSPLEVSEFEGRLDAPAGLSAEGLVGSLTALPTVKQDLGPGTQLRLEVLDPGGEVLAAAMVDRTERSTGLGGGRRVVLEEVNGIFTITRLFDLKNGTSDLALEIPPTVGKAVTAVFDALTFLTGLHEPNTLRSSLRNAPALSGASEPMPPLPSGDDMDGLRRHLRLVSMLNRFQQHAPFVIAVPGPDELTEGKFNALKLAAAILEGASPTIRLREGESFKVTLNEDVALPSGPCRVAVPIRVQIAGRVVDLGLATAHMVDPVLIEEVVDGITLTCLRPADGRVTFTREKVDSAD